MENYVDQIKNIKISTYEIALCNGTIEEELSKLNDTQLEYLKSEIEVDDSLEDKNILLESVDFEIRKRETEKRLQAFNNGEYLSSAQLTEKLSNLIIERLEFLENKDVMIEAVSSIDTLTLKNIKYFISKEELSPKRLLIMDTIEQELSHREELNKNRSL